jgi:hypothetical protein
VQYEAAEGVNVTAGNGLITTAFSTVVNDCPLLKQLMVQTK